MIKIKLRKNLIYLLIYFICAFVDYNILGILLPQISGFDPIYICIFFLKIRENPWCFALFLLNLHPISNVLL